MGVGLDWRRLGSVGEEGSSDPGWSGAKGRIQKGHHGPAGPVSAEEWVWDGATLKESEGE